jgi:IS30 family transposase
MARASEQDPDFAQIVAQLDDLKRLAILQLLASGVQSSHIAKALGIHSSVISRMMPVREIKKVAANRSQIAE